MKASYQVVSPRDSRQLSEFLAREGQFLLPMLDLITQAEMAVDELIDVAGRATIEAVLTLSAPELAEAKHLGRRGDGHGAEVDLLAYASMQNDSRLGRWMSCPHWTSGAESSSWPRPTSWPEGWPTWNTQARLAHSVVTLESEGCEEGLHSPLAHCGEIATLLTLLPLMCSCEAER